MVSTTINREMARVQWGPAIGGAFIAFAVATVLALFGAAFGFGARSSGSQGLGVLSGVWEILTPLVATFIGAAFAATMSDRRSAYLNGVMVWCMDLAFGVLILSALVAASRAPFGVSSGTMALGGLAAILGLIGGLFGAAVSSAVTHRRVGAAAGRTTEPAQPDRYRYREIEEMPGSHVEPRPGVGERAPSEEDPLH